MTNQPKTPGAMVLKPCPFCGESLRINNSNLGVHPRESDCLFRQQVVVTDSPEQVAAWNRRTAEQTPAVGACSHRFMSMADDPRRCADCNEPESAVGGELEECLLWLDDFVASCNGDDRGSCSALNAIRSHVAPLLAEIERLKNEVGQVKGEYDRAVNRIDALRGELEAQQGEPVAYVLHKSGEVDWDQETVISNTGGDEQDERWKWEPVFRQAKPATANVVLPERMSQPSRDEYESTDHYAAALHEVKTWNACLEELARLNP